MEWDRRNLVIGGIIIGVIGDICVHFLPNYKIIIAVLYSIVIAFVIALYETYRENINKQFVAMSGRFEKVLENKHLTDAWNKISERFTVLRNKGRKETLEATETLYSFIGKGLSVLEEGNIPVYNRGEYIGKIDSYLRELVSDKPEQIVYLALLNFRSAQSWRASWSGKLFDQLLEAKDDASKKGMAIISIFLLDSEISEESVRKIQKEDIFEKHMKYGPTFPCKGEPTEGFRDNQCAILLKMKKTKTMDEILDVENKKLKIGIADVDIEKSVIFLEEVTDTGQLYAGRVIYNKIQIERLLSRYDKTLRHCSGDACFPCQISRRC